MSSTESTHTRIHLVLNVQEANWLKNVMQNPFCSVGEDPEAPESSEDGKMRTMFFSELVKCSSLEKFTG